MVPHSCENKAISAPAGDWLAGAWAELGNIFCTSGIRQVKSKVKARSRGKFNNSNSLNEYQINFYRLTPYEHLQQ